MENNENSTNDWENSELSSTSTQSQVSNSEAQWGNLEEDFKQKNNIEDEMLKSFTGKNFERILSSKTNWAAAVTGQAIGPVWLFFRKCPLLGFAFIVITLVIGWIAASINIKEASYIMFVIYLFCANPIYIWNAKRKIAKIIESNPNSSDEALIAIAKEKGGTSVVGAIIYCVVFVLLMIAFIFLTTLALSYKYRSLGL